MKKLKMLAIDLGASSGRGIVGSFDGEKIELRENHRFSNDPVINAGMFNWDILRIFHEIKESMRQCALSDDRDIASMGIDTWGVDFGLLDSKGHLLGNPTHYRDERNLGMAEYSYKFVPRDELYARTGIQTIDFNSLFQLLAIKKDTPELLSIAKDMLFIPDLLNYFLTGNKQTEYTIASTGQLLDANARDWAWDLIKRYGLPENIFRNIVMPGTPCGSLLAQVKEEVGGIDPKVISVAAHDTGSAVVSVPAKGEKFIFISSGTWSIMGTETKQPVISEKSNEYNFTNEGGYGGTIRFSKNITGLWLEQESRRQWAREGKKYSYDELSDMALTAKPLRFLVNPDEPILGIPGNIPQRIREYCEKTGQGKPETMGEIVRCIFDSIALRYRWVIDKIDEMCGEKLPAINIVGGGTKEKMLSKFAATACKRPVFTGPVEATAMGNIAAQAIAMGELHDLSEAREVIARSTEMGEYYPVKEDEAMWDEAYERFCKLV
ncbi:MAG: rhamnulokinase family protein [Eubacteriales bacterium]|nr:rhamnulokinase [Eubacterium sp.]MDY5493191.1 rhamnulokinase family protein [Eubacteriales bacterium]